MFDDYDAMQGGDGVSGGILADDVARLSSSVAEALRDKHAQDILEIDVREFSGVADFFLLATALSEVNLQTLTETAVEAFDRSGLPVRVEGELSKRWRLVDCGGVVVHLFSREGRDYYRLERLFEDLPIRRIDAID